MSTDPAYAAIEAHRQAWAHLDEVVHTVSQIEASVPIAQRRSNIIPGEGVQVMESDDPRWIAAIKANYKAIEDITATEDTFATVQPTTVAGIVTLLRYVCDFNEGRDLFDIAPSVLNLAGALERIAPAA